MKISQALLDQMIAHAQRDAPDECCGAVGVKDGVATKVYELENLAHSPLKFELGIDLFHALEDIEESGAELGAIYHSHTRTAPYPSQTDQNWSEQYPGAEWIIVGVADGAVEVKSYLVTRSSVEEVPVEVQ